MRPTKTKLTMSTSIIAAMRTLAKVKATATSMELTRTKTSSHIVLISAWIWTASSAFSIQIRLPRRYLSIATLRRMKRRKQYRVASTIMRSQPLKWLRMSFTRDTSVRWA